ncbi:MAG: DNA polymerase III subunit gamma/tau [Gammaproteobacteria bacterium]|nr:DNA polymerase III subunit gamma/tau [Gammaproteobacteria bacterium]
MSYQVLARKWRPHSFQEMVGQEHVLRMLINALDSQRLHHAYLFTGTRGVGKTSLARLLAKCLNCETGITSKPCDQCSACQSIDAGRFLDLLEIDAASRTKVEDTRELLENVQYAPTQGRFKVYLIDEVHMLSGHSFNALLKTLEEPPAHVKFLLATTDPKRLPVTILSRCLQFNLKRVPVDQITKQLQHISQAENIAFEPLALEQLAMAADGSMRDSLSLLDQAIAFCRDQITLDDVRRMLGNVEQDYLFRLLDALALQDGKKLLTEVAHLAEQSPDFSHVLENLLSILHQIAVTQTVPAIEQDAPIADLAKRLIAEEVQLYYQIALLGRKDLPLAPSPLQGFEMIMLRMLAFKPATSEPQKPVSQAIPTLRANNPAAPTEKTAAPAKAVNTINPADGWTEILSKIGLTGMTNALASHCALISQTDNTFELALSKKHEPMLNKKIHERLEETLTEYYGKKITVTIKITSEELNTSAKQQEETQKIRLASAVDAITSDDQVQKIMDVFGATLDVNSIKAIN